MGETKKNSKATSILKNNPLTSIVKGNIGIIVVLITSAFNMIKSVLSAQHRNHSGSDNHVRGCSICHG